MGCLVTTNFIKNVVPFFQNYNTFGHILVNYRKTKKLSSSRVVMIECSKNLDVKDHAKVEILMIIELMVAHSYGEKEILLKKNEEKTKEKELERALEM